MKIPSIPLKIEKTTSYILLIINIKEFFYFLLFGELLKMNELEKNNEL